MKPQTKILLVIASLAFLFWLHKDEPPKKPMLWQYLLIRLP